MQRYLLFILISIISSVTPASANKMRDPNRLQKSKPQFSRTSLLFMDYTQHSHKEAPLSLSNQYGYTFLRLYQTGFGKFIKSHCPMQPSCSHYSIEAVSQYGLIRGVILTADRLLHEIDEAALVEKIWIKGRGYCCLDPVSRNVMWTENSNPIASSFSLQLKETK